jgi:hypothetical protein
MGKSMSHPFGDLVKRHLSQRHGFSQKNLAVGIFEAESVISRMCRRGEGLNRDRVMSVISYLHDHKLLKFLEEANELLEAAGLARLSENDEEEVWLIEQLPQRSMTAAFENTPLFSKQTFTLSKEQISVLAAHLVEWKIVHKYVQEMLLANRVLENEIRDFTEVLTKQKAEVMGIAQETTSRMASRLHNTWYAHCNSKADDIVSKFPEFKFINTEKTLINKLVYILQYDDRLIVCIEACIRGFDDKKFRSIQSGFYKLQDTLTELLRAADEQIMMIADELMNRSTQH